MNDLARRPVAVALLLLGSAALLLPALGAAPLERAEIYFLDGARTMVETGDYLVPRYRGEPFFDKPPLAYWLMAASFRLLGPEPAAARLVSVLAALGAVAATVWLGGLLLDRRTALAGGAVLATTAAFMGFGRIAMSDMLVALLSTLAVALGAVAARPGAGGWAVPALGLVLGVGFLTKGPVAVLLPAIGLGLLVRSGRRPRAGPLAWSAAAVAFAVFGLGWFVLLQDRLGWQPLAHFFLRENVERFAGETYDTGRDPFFYVVSYLALGLPFSLLLTRAAWRALRGDEPQAPRARLLVAWVAFMAVPLSLSRGKIDYYLLPLYPPVSLVVGWWFTTTWRRADRLWAAVGLAAAALALVTLSTVPARLPQAWRPGPIAAAFAVGAALAGASALAVSALRPRPLRTLTALGAASAGVFLYATALFVPAFQGGQPHADLVADVIRERRHRPEARLVFCDDPALVQRNVLFEARLPGEQRCDLWNPAASRVPFLLLLTSRERAALSTVPSLRTVSEHRFLPASTLTLRGLLRRPEPVGIVLSANFETDDPVAEAKRKRERRKALRGEGDEKASVILPSSGGRRRQRRLERK